MMTSRANRVGAHSETMIFTRATHKGSLQPISMICPKVAGRSLAESVNLPARCRARRLKAALEEAGVIFTAGGAKLGRSLRGGRVPEQLNAEKDG